MDPWKGEQTLLAAFRHRPLYTEMLMMNILDSEALCSITIVNICSYIFTLVSICGKIGHVVGALGASPYTAAIKTKTLIWYILMLLYV